MGAQEWGIAIPVITVVIWLIRLEGRVNVQDALLRQLRDDVGYIRSRIDRAINGHGE
jgi:hypothetical protein